MDKCHVGVHLRICHAFHRRCEKLNTEKEWPLYHAITKILKVATLHRVSDYYGPILYDGFGTADQKPQSQEEVYKRFFEDLATAVNILKDYKGGVSFESADFMMPEGKRTPAQWLKFANSLRLRLAMRVSNVAPALAEEQAKAALDSKNGGVLETANGNSGAIRHPQPAGWCCRLERSIYECKFGVVPERL